MLPPPLERIAVLNLGPISGVPTHPIKFILLEDGTLLFGKVEFHKDLMRAHLNGRLDSPVVIAAGSVPEDIEACGLDVGDWGGWKSTGFDVRTPVAYRSAVRDALLPFAREIAGLSNRTI